MKFKRDVEFRKWMSSMLGQCILQGYVVNNNRIAHFGEVIQSMKHVQNSLYRR